MMFYATHNPYGRHTLNVEGNQANTLRAFSGKRERDEWIAKDEEHRYRVEAPKARSIMRYEALMGGDPLAVMSEGLPYMDRMEK